MSLSSRRAWFSCDVQAGPGEQQPPVVAGLGHPGAQAQPAAAAAVVDQLDLVDVEAQLVEPADPLGDPVALLVAAARPPRGQLVPQAW